MTTTAPPVRQYPLSLNQHFLRAFDTGDADGAFGERHVLAGAWRVHGPVDAAALGRALDDVVQRHEVLRTVVARGSAEPVQSVLPHARARLVVRDLPEDGRSRECRAEALLNEVDATPVRVAELPHLRAVLGRLDAEDAVLVLATHHTATDGWSLGLLARDLLAAYAARVGAPGAPLPPARAYGEFAGAQAGIADDPALTASLAHWRERLAGGRIVAVPTDRVKDRGRTAEYGAHRFALEPAVSAAVLRYARSARSTPFMVLLAAYAVVLTRRAGVRDVVVPTFTSGRYDPDHADTVGPFFNMCPLRVDLDGVTTFAGVLDRTRASCLDAFSHEVPFALIAGADPELTAAFGDDRGDVIAFEVLQSPAEQDLEAGGLRLVELRRRVLSQQVSSGIPNGALWALDVLPSGEVVGSLKYDANHFDAATAVGLVEEFREVLRAGTAGPDRPLAR